VLEGGANGAVADIDGLVELGAGEGRGGGEDLFGGPAVVAQETVK
jgi:hypothetical protein